MLRFGPAAFIHDFKQPFMLAKAQEPHPASICSAAEAHLMTVGAPWVTSSMLTTRGLATRSAATLFNQFPHSS
jgi:hypothetical protein